MLQEGRTFNTVEQRGSPSHLAFKATLLGPKQKLVPLLLSETFSALRVASWHAIPQPGQYLVVFYEFLPLRWSDEDLLSERIRSYTSPICHVVDHPQFLSNFFSLSLVVLRHIPHKLIRSELQN